MPTSSGVSVSHRLTGRGLAVTGSIHHDSPKGHIFFLCLCLHHILQRQSGDNRLNLLNNRKYFTLHTTVYGHKRPFMGISARLWA